MRQKILFSFILLVFSNQLSAQKTTPTIKNEADVPSYELPQLLNTLAGKKINTPFHGTVGYHLREGKYDVTNYD